MATNPNDVPARRSYGPGNLKPRKSRVSPVLSQKILQIHQHDPIVEQINLYRKIMDEVTRMEEWRDGVRVMLDAKGQEMKYGAMARDSHFALFDKASKINDTLMRYAYGRVPEGNLPSGGQRAPTLLIDLSGEGDVLEISAPNDPRMVEEGDEADEDEYAAD